MRYEDASGAFQASGPIANDDADTLTAGQRGPATGNLITGEGTQYGSAGADSAAGARVTAIAGRGGEDNSFSGGKLSIDGEHGRLTVDAEGNYSYLANANVENVRDRFTYTLADNAGNSDTAALVVEIGKTPAVIKAGAQQIVPGPDGVVTLPPGVELSDIRVVGRNLVVDLPDGTQLIIVDGAIFVPQLVLDGVQVPATNVASLLVGQEVQPAAGELPPSSGGNFALPPPPLDPGIPLGDLIPPTEYNYNPPEPEEVLEIENDEPEAGLVSVQLDDDALAGGIAGGTGDDPDSVNATGFLPASGGDGDLTWSLLLTGAPAGFTYVDGPGESILIQQGGVTVLTVTVNPATGEYSVVQNAPIDHAAGENENNVSFTIEYLVTDEDGDTAVGTLNIDADDDTPTVDVTAASDANVVLTTQDAQTDGDPTDTDTATSTAHFGGVFGGTSAFGADGAGTSSTSYALSTTGGASGLTQHGAPINLYLIGGVVVGSTAASAGAVNAGNTVFDISVNGSGVVTVNQYSQIDHSNTDPSPTGPGYEDHLITLADGSVTLTRTDTVTDGDGDTVTDSAAVGIGANIQFADDGPTIDPTLNEVGGAVVDESEPVEAATIPLVGGYTAGDDPHLSGGLAIGKGSTSGPVIDANAAFGADGPANGGGISYALDVLNTISGLTTTEGTAINLVELANGVVVGVVDGTTTVAFAISIDSNTGVVTVEQYLSLFHPDSPDNFDEPVFLDEGSLGVTVTATDFDGDSVTSDAVDITSLIRFEDDGPTVNPALNADATVTVDESLPSSVPAINTGAIVKGNDPDLADATGTAIGQGSSGSAVVNANAVFGADGPAAQGSIVYSLSITNSDAGVTLTDGTTITLQMVNGVIVGVVDSGPFDGQAAFAIAINPTTGVVTVEQYLSLDHPDATDPNDPLGLGDGTVAVNVTATDGDGDQIESDGVDISGQITFLDDGPSVTPALSTDAAAIVDESPPVAVATIDTGPYAKGDDPDLVGGLAIGSGSTTLLDTTAVFGADGPGADGGVSYALTIINPASGLTLTDGSAISLVLLPSGVVVGVVQAGVFAGQAAFAISINPDTGVATAELYLSLDHPENPNPNDVLTLAPGSLGAVVTATDGDGDTATSAVVDVSGRFNFYDDGPSVDATLSTAGPAVVDESEPVSAPAIDTGGITKADDPHLSGGLAIGSGTTAGAVINANAVFGADGPATSGSLSYDLVILNASSGLTTTEGNPINLVELPSGVIVGVVSGGPFNGQAAFAISINSTTGVVTVEQYLSIDHPDFPNNFDEPVFLAEDVLGATVTATDGDGDPVTSDAVDIGSKIRFEDDGPSATDEPQQNVQEGNQTVAGTFDFVGGADGASVTHINDIALTFGGDGWSQWIPVDDGQIRAQADGDYQFQSDASGSGVTTGTFTVTDGDGDQIKADWAFNITDANSPTAGTSNARLDDDGLAGGNPLSTTNDIDANIGEAAPVNAEEDIFHGQLTLNFGGDGAGTVTFAAMHNLTGTVGTETVRYTWAGSTLTATVEGGARNGTVLFDIVVNQTTGEYTLTLRDNVIHAAGGDETSAPNVALTYTVTDSDNSPAGGVNGTLNITFNDDAPTVTNVQAGAGVDVDETDAGTPSGFPISDTSAGAVITATQAFGADGAAAANSVVYGLAITGGPSSGLQTAIGNFAITLVQIDADTIQGQYQNGGTQVAFTVQMNANGTVTLTQNVPLEHNTDSGPAPTGHNDTLDLTGLINATITITDGDGDTASGSAPIGDNLVFFDDGPDAQVDGQATLDQLVLDETRPLGTETDGDSNPAGLATITANFANNFIGPVDYGADGAGATTYSLFLSANGIGSGLFALDPTDTETAIDGYGKGAEITLSINGAGTVITGSVGPTPYFTISIDPATGVVTFTQLLNVWHANTANDDDTSSLMTAAASNIQVVQRVTDSDGDFDTASVNIGQGVFHIEDDGPEILLATDAVGDNTGLTPSVTGDFDFDIGTDSPNGGNDDISIDPTSVVIEINGVVLDPVANEIVFTEGIEDANFARYSFSFKYANGPSSTTTATGTLVFDKTAGTYTVTLTSGPIEGFTTLETEAGTAFVGYQLNTDPGAVDVLDNTQPQVAVTTIVDATPGEDDGFYVQFTGFGAGNGSHETIDYDPVDPSTGNGAAATWVEGELFSEGTGTDALWNSWVSVSGTANGVGGDQTNGPDALNFDLYSTNPGGTVGGLPTASASDMFLHFDTIGAGHDMIVVLKLWSDTNGNGEIDAADAFTTKAIVVQNSDIYKFDAANEAATVAELSGTQWEGVVTEIVGENGNNNDGLVIIESSDYNEAGESWQIVGAQVVNAALGVTGDGVNLNPDVGAGGDSDINNDGTLDPQSLAVITDTNPLKIMNIGFLTGNTVDQSFELSFDVTITDADGDSETASLTATIGDPPAEALMAESSFSTQSFSMMAANDDYSSLLAGDSIQKSYVNGGGFGNVGNTGITSAMVAASGLAALSMTSINSFGQPTFDSMLQDSFQSLSNQVVGREAIGGEDYSSLSLGGGYEPSFDTVNMSSTGFNFGDTGFGGGSLDAMSTGGAEPSFVPSYASGEPAIANVPAFAANVPTVSMASAAMLQAANLSGDAQHGGAVEQILADALGNQAPTIDAILANLPGGLAELAAISNMASPDGTGVPAWDMGMQGGFAPMQDMLMKVAAVEIHQDAVQPA